MIRSIALQGLSWACACLLVADAAVLVGALRMQHRLTHVAASVISRDDGARPVPFEGFAGNGQKIALAPSLRGLAVRYASRACPVCLADREWVTLAPLLEARGIGVVVLTPDSRLVFPREALVPSAAFQAVYVDVEWARQYRLVVTPTVMIFGRRQSLLWHHEGLLSSGDMHAAIGAVDHDTSR